MSLEPRSLLPFGRPKPQPQAKSKPKDAPPEPKDQLREFVETIVFVTVLVMLLRTFVTEAFVIPTGSMAETLLGYQKITTCPKCGHVYPVNSTDEADPQNGAPPVRISGGTCPNCQYHDNWDAPGRSSPSWSSGDKVIVKKTYEGGPLGKPDRWNVVVFKFPKQPQVNQVAMNYIKRLVGLPGETIAIYDGDVYVNPNLQYPDGEKPDDPKQLWRKRFMYEDDPAAVESFKNGEFKILHRPLPQLLAMKRLVYDNDKPASDLIGKVPPRWRAESNAWKPDNPDKPLAFTQVGDAAELAWVRYHHLVVRVPLAEGPNPPMVFRGADRPVPAAAALTAPELIRNVQGYNTNFPTRQNIPPEAVMERDWVGDLLLECELDVQTAAGEFVLELSRGESRFRARFDLAKGQCHLHRAAAGGEVLLGTAASAVSKPGKYQLRFANVDQRLTVWVDGKLPFGDGLGYPPPAKGGPDPINDKQPASFGVSGTGRVTVRHLKLWRDTYYTPNVMDDSFNRDGPILATRYVQPGHYLVLGDNSTHSADSRDWGTVPERLMLGRAVFIYYPFLGYGPVGSPVNRVGPIW